MIFLTVSKKSILFGIVWLLFLAIFLTLSVPEVNILISSPQKIGFSTHDFSTISEAISKSINSEYWFLLYFSFELMFVFFCSYISWIMTTFLKWKLLKTSSTERAEWSQFIITYIIPLSIHVQPMWFYNLG